MSWKKPQKMARQISKKIRTEKVLYRHFSACLYSIYVCIFSVWLWIQKIWKRFILPFVNILRKMFNNISWIIFIIYWISKWTKSNRFILNINFGSVSEVFQRVITFVNFGWLTASSVLWDGKSYFNWNHQTRFIPFNSGYA